MSIGGCEYRPISFHANATASSYISIHSYFLVLKDHVSRASAAPARFVARI